MFGRTCCLGISVLILLAMFSSITTVLTALPVFAQEEIFTVSPGEFTVRDAPPMGEPWRIPKKIIVWNRDNVPRVVSITVETPSENMVRPGYEPIPDENWVRPFPSSILIEENSYAEVEISINIPRWENLTGQRWEVWIPVERQPLPGEIGVLRPTIRMKIETTEELPTPSPPFEYMSLLIALAAGIAIIAVGAGIWSRRRGRRKVGMGMLSRSWR